MKTHSSKPARKLRSLGAVLSLTLLGGSFGDVFATSSLIEDFCRRHGENETQIQLCISRGGKTQNSVKPKGVSSLTPSVKSSTSRMTQHGPQRPDFSRDVFRPVFIGHDREIAFWMGEHNDRIIDHNGALVYEADEGRVVLPIQQTPRGDLYFEEGGRVHGIVVRPGQSLHVDLNESERSFSRRDSTLPAESGLSGEDSSGSYDTEREADIQHRMRRDFSETEGHAFVNPMYDEEPSLQLARDPQIIIPYVQGGQIHYYHELLDPGSASEEKEEERSLARPRSLSPSMPFSGRAVYPYEDENTDDLVNLDRSIAAPSEYSPESEADMANFETYMQEWGASPDRFSDDNPHLRPDIDLSAHHIGVSPSSASSMSSRLPSGRHYIDNVGSYQRVPKGYEPTFDFSFGHYVRFENQGRLLTRPDNSAISIPVTGQIQGVGKRKIIYFKDRADNLIRNSQGDPVSVKLHQGGNGFMFYDNGDNSVTLVTPDGALQYIISKAQARRQGIILEEEQEHDEEEEEEE